MEKMSIAITIHETKVVLMEIVITAKNLGISKQIAIRNRVMNKQILMKPVNNAISLDMSKKISARQKRMNNKISQRENK